MSREVIGWGRRDDADADPSDPSAPPSAADPATTTLLAEGTDRLVAPGGALGAPGALDDLGAPDDLDEPDQAPPDGPGWLDRLGGRGRRRLLGAVVTLTTALGLSAPALGPTELLERPTPVVVALVTEGRSQTPAHGAGSTTLRVAVSNLSPSPVQLVGFDTAFVAAEVAGSPDAGRTVAPGTTLLTDVGVTVLCDASSPLVLPTLRLRDRDGVEFHVPVAGSVQALVDSCTGGETPPVLSLSGPTVIEESRLKVTLATLGGRTLRLLAMNLDDVGLTGRPLPSTMDNPTRVVWLNAPDTCPDLWRSRGLPSRLDVVVATTLDRRYDGEGTAAISLPVGPVLAQWLSVTACKGVP